MWPELQIHTPKLNKQKSTLKLGKTHYKCYQKTKYAELMNLNP